MLEPNLEMVTWIGPHQRVAEIAGDGCFVAWRHPYLSGHLDLPGVRVVDHPVGWGEAVQAAWIQAPWLHGSGCLAVMLAIFVVVGGMAEAAALALLLRLPGALSPAWFFDSDATSYHAVALDLVGGRGMSVDWPPIWPATLALFSAMVSAEPSVARMSGVVLGVALVPLVALVVPKGRGCGVG